MTIRVLLADDHPLTRAGLSAYLQKETGIELVGEAEDGRIARLALHNLARRSLRRFPILEHIGKSADRLWQVAEHLERDMRQYAIGTLAAHHDLT